MFVYLLQTLPESQATLINIASALFKSLGRLTPLAFTLIPSLIAVILYFTLRRMKATHLNWVPYLPLVIGVILGIFGWIAISSSLYVQMESIGQRSFLIYRAVLIAPILTAIGLFLLSKFGDGRMDSNL
ncbi:hypothetical protein C0431_07115 [bacterium]|nr:hypothetical protein [bacterium]